MFPRRTLPITLGVLMIVAVVALIVGWVVLAVFGLMHLPTLSPLYITLLAVGSILLVLLLLGVVMYLVFSIQAVNLSRRQSNFIDAVTHELKSPIASMKLALQTLSRHDEMGEQQKAAFHQAMMEDLERLDRLINQVLDAGRLERGVALGEIEDVDLDEVLRACAESVCTAYRVPADCVDLTSEPCVVRGRRIELEMVFRNLIDNAVKYAAHDPRVEVSLRCLDDDHAVVRVADNGRGIPRHLQKKIFERFERLGMELVRDKPGTGLGLYIVMMLVRQLRGRIRVEERSEGTGAVFEVHIPRRRAAEGAGRAAPPG